MRRVTRPTRRLVLAAGGALLLPCAARAQPGTRRRIATLALGSRAGGVYWEAFWQGLRALGYGDQELAIESRWADGYVERLPGLAAELVRLAPEVIVVGQLSAAQAAKRATATIPIVVTTANDPVGAGLVASIAHPGGNVTGLSTMHEDIAGKQLELLKIAVPRAERIAVLVDPGNPSHAGVLQGVQQAARTLRTELFSIEARAPDEIDSAFAAMASEHADAFVVLGGPFAMNQTRRITELAASHKLPAIYYEREIVAVGGLMGYGADLKDMYRRAATYVDKILKGEKPAALLAVLLLAPRYSTAQQSQAKIPRVGILSVADTERAPIWDAFRQGLRDLGYVEGRNIIIEFRLARGNLFIAPQLAAELVALPVDLIAVEGITSNAVTATDRIPIVSPVMMDPVTRGFATSLSRPGGNITGLTLMHTELNAKRLDLLRAAFPNITAVTALVNPANPSHALAFEETETAARSMGLGSVARAEAESVAALRALRPAVFSGASAVVVVPDGMFYSYRRDVVGLVNAARLPAIYPEREYADDGGLMAYGANVLDSFRRAAGYVDRILKAAKPRDLPIQEPVKFDFVVNLETAKELGLTIPPSILARADEVIE